MGEQGGAWEQFCSIVIGLVVGWIAVLDDDIGVGRMGQSAFMARCPATDQNRAPQRSDLMSEGTMILLRHVKTRFRLRHREVLMRS